MKYFEGLQGIGNLLTAYRNNIYLLNAATSQLQIFDQISESIRKCRIEKLKDIESIESIHVISDHAWIIVRKLERQLVVSVVQLFYKFGDYMHSSFDSVSVLELRKNMATIPIENDDQYRV